MQRLLALCANIIYQKQKKKSYKLHNPSAVPGHNFFHLCIFWNTFSHIFRIKYLNQNFDSCLILLYVFLWVRLYIHFILKQIRKSFCENELWRDIWILYFTTSFNTRTLIFYLNCNFSFFFCYNFVSSISNIT